MSNPPVSSSSESLAPYYEVRQSRDHHGYLIQTRQFLPRPQQEVFAFFENPANLARITPPWLQFRIREPNAVEMERNARIRYTIFWLGIPLGWTTHITGYDPPHFFEDTQTRGPYARWVHQHHFRTENGGTWIEDEVSYRLPFGPIGSLAHAVLVGPQLRAIFAFRGRTIEALLAPDGKCQQEAS